MLIGYKRVSTYEQTMALQEDALNKAGCEIFFSDIASGAKTDRKGLDEAIAYMREKDVLVVWRLDRLGRSLQHLKDMINLLEEKGCGFKSITEGFDTTTNNGKLIFHIFGAMAEFERNLIQERVQAGLHAARARGRVGGRPQALDEKEKAMALTLYADKNNSIADICKALNVSRATLYRYLPKKN